MGGAMCLAVPYPCVVLVAAARLHPACPGQGHSRRWVPFRNWRTARLNPLFEQRCEKPLKLIADAYSDLFEDLVTMFSGTSSFNNFSSDISVVLYPFPKVPVLICYWKPRMNRVEAPPVLRRHREKNLHIESLFTLGTGLVRMLEKIMHRHTDGKSELS